MALVKDHSNGAAAFGVGHFLDVPYLEAFSVGRLIIVGIACYANGATVATDFTVTDSHANEFYVVVGSIGTGAASYTGIAWCLNDTAITGSGDYIRVGYSGDQNWEKWFTAGYVVYEDSSTIPNPPDDIENSSDTTAATWSVSTGSNIAQGNEVIVGVVTHDGYEQQDPYTIDMTLTGDWTEATHTDYKYTDTRNQAIHFHSKVVTSVGTYNSTGDLGQNSDGGNPYRRMACIAAFKGATPAAATNIIRVSKRIRW